MEPAEERTTFAQELRAHLDARGKSLSELHRRLADHGLPISMAALSYWRSGARQPEGAQSLAAIDDIEDILGLDRGHLSRLIRPASRVSRRSEPKPAFAVDEVNRQVEETASALGTVAQADLRDLSVSIVAHVDAGGNLERITTRALVQAMSRTISEIPLFDVVPPDVAQAKTITGVIGGTVDRSLRHPAGRIVCDVIALDDPIAPGETGLIEYTETVPADYPERRDVWHGVDRQNRQIVIWVRFQDDGVPDWCEEYTEAGADHTANLRAVGRRSVHVARFGFGPGVLGIRWGFDADD